MKGDEMYQWKGEVPATAKTKNRTAFLGVDRKELSNSYLDAFNLKKTIIDSLAYDELLAKIEQLLSDLLDDKIDTIVIDNRKRG